MIVHGTHNVEVLAADSPVPLKGVPNAHSVARLAYPWSPWTPDRPWPAASVSPSRVHPAEPHPSRSPRRYSAPSEREHRASTTPSARSRPHERQPHHHAALSTPPMRDIPTGMSGATQITWCAMYQRVASLLLECMIKDPAARHRRERQGEEPSMTELGVVPALPAIQG